MALRGGIGRQILSSFVAGGWRIPFHAVGHMREPERHPSTYSQDLSHKISHGTTAVLLFIESKWATREWGKEHD